MDVKGILSICIFICLLVVLGCLFINVYMQRHVIKLIINYNSKTDGAASNRNSLYEANPQNRYLSIGFDDFRISDWTTIFPLFKEYGVTTTYNRVARNTTLSRLDVALIDTIVSTGNELGDHTWFHVDYIFNDPLFNGQDPERTEGTQNVYPSNEQMRTDRGDGKNVFGFDLTGKVTDFSDYINGIETTWRDLSDEECQNIRNLFSIYRDETGILDTLDKLSNKYLGTVGKSKGSWNEETHQYEGGIFTGSKTSCNHEIWERVLEITKAFYQDQYDQNFTFCTWSWPGGHRSPFGYEHDGMYYYDEEYTLLKNYMAQFPSSMYSNEDDTPKMRSWVQLLRDTGYRVSHDIIHPSREDGVSLPMMSKWLIYNASFSRKDALPYSTNRTVHYLAIANDYPESFFSSAPPQKREAAQMYDDGGIFYTFIEEMRKNTSNGMIQGEVIDSQDTYSEKMFLQQILEYCKATGVEVIPHNKAYDVCFNQTFVDGNLIYNPSLRNTAKEFMPEAENVPDNPDGYTGECYVKQNVNKQSVLAIDGTAQYLHYGIPVGKISYSANIKGSGNIKIYAIKNSDSIELNNDDLELLQFCTISAEKENLFTVDFVIPDNPETEYEQICEGLGNKVMGIKIAYSGKLELENIDLRLLESY